MYFRNYEMGKALPQNTKPTPFPRITASEQTQASSPSVNTLNRNCNEFINEGHSYKSMSTINLGSTNVSGFSDGEPDDETDNADFSNDPHQRLIL